MRRLILLLIVLFPFIELAVMIRVGSRIGVVLTLLLVLAALFAGVAFLRKAVLATALRARARMALGELPEQDMLEALLIAAGAMLLIFPGFISDLLGIFCLLPISRRLILAYLRRRMAQRALYRRAFADDPQAQPEDGPQVFEGEYQRRDDTQLR